MRAPTWGRCPRSTGCCAGPGRAGNGAAQATHPATVKPELLATGPNQVWSWDITKLRGPAKWTYFYLYVILDVFSRYVVGWMVADRESAELAKRLIAETCGKQGIAPRPAHHPRRPRLVHDLQAGRLAAGRPRASPRPTVPAPRLRRQPVLGEPVQDPEVPARISRTASAPSRTPALSARTSSPGTTTSTATPASACSPPPMVHHGRRRRRPAPAQPMS